MRFLPILQLFLETHKKCRKSSQKGFGTYRMTRNSHPTSGIRKRSVREMRSASSSSSKTNGETAQRLLLQKMLASETLLIPSSPLTNSLHRVAKRRKLLTAMIAVAPSVHRHHAWREQTAKWCYDVIDHMELSRDMVHITMNILERYLDSKEITNKTEYELSAIASLFLAVRMSTTTTKTQKKLQISDLLIISGARWTVSDIQITTARMLQALQLLKANDQGVREWNSPFHQALVHATPQSFARVLLSVSAASSSSEVDKETKRSWMEMALYLLELSVCDGSFRYLLPSQVALASILVASKKINKLLTRSQMKSMCQQMTPISEDLSIICKRLEHVYRQSQESTDGSTSPTSYPTLILDDEEEEERFQNVPAVTTFATTTVGTTAPLTNSRPISPCTILNNTTSSINSN